MSAIPKGLFFGGTTSLFQPNGGRVGTTYDDDVTELGDVSDAGDDDLEENTPAGSRSRKREHSPGQGDRPAKTPRTGGAKAPIGKGIDPNPAKWDEDDMRIVALKTQGYSDEYVANKLVEEKRIRYAPKTVASRYASLKRVARKHEDERLDDEMNDWRVGEDDQLRESYNIVETKFNLEVQKLAEKKWGQVSDKLAERLQIAKKYTAKACKERWEALVDGTALPPIELDPDKEGRAVLRETRIAAAKQARAEAALAVQQAEEAKERAVQQRKDQKLSDFRERQEEKRAKEAEKAEARKFMAVKKAAKEQEKFEKAENARKIKEEADQKKVELEKTAIIFEYLTGKKLKPRKRPSAVNKSVDDEDDVEDDYEDLPITSSGRRTSGRHNKTINYNEQSDGDEGNDSDLNDNDEYDAAEEADESAGPTCAAEKPASNTCSFKLAEVTKETLNNPRTIMADDELDALLYERELPKRGGGETHPQVVARLAAADNELSANILKDLLGRYFEKAKDKRVNRIHRLQSCDAKNSAAGQDGVTVEDPTFRDGYEGYKGEYAALLE